MVQKLCPLTADKLIHMEFEKTFVLAKKVNNLLIGLPLSEALLCLGLYIL